jgi:hypothetical protein
MVKSRVLGKVRLILTAVLFVMVGIVAQRLATGLIMALLQATGVVVLPSGL